MNYIKEINAFRNYLKTNSLEAITQALWYVIIDYHNSCNWERWIAIDNQRLMAELSISEKTLIRHRNKLIQAGLLEYKSQQRKKSSGRYKLLSFGLGETGRKDKTAGKNTADGKAAGGADKGAVEEADGSDIYKLNKTKQIDDIDNSQTPFQETVELFRKAGMGEINQTIAEVLGDIADNYPLELIQEAFKRAGIKNATSIRYVEKILISWERKGIKSLAQLEAYENNRRGNYGTSKGDNGRSSQGDDPYAGIGLTL